MLPLAILYVLSAVFLALLGFNTLVLSAVYLHHRRDSLPTPPAPAVWPHIAVQLPVYNERHVVERLIHAAAALDYPAERLTIQLLDDSSDETSAIAQACLATYHERGLDVQHVRRATREGYKAGALAVGLASSEAELVAIFDADFVPPTDFLKRIVPHFADERVGMVQARWSHLNPGHNLLTRAQAIALDAHFVVEQTARQRGGLLMGFNGSAGMWRRACIEDSGGWQGDTLSEDTDLSFRAQLRGWRFLYLPEVEAPAEIPPQIAALKRQQARWATGTVQCLLKLWRPLWAGRLTFWQGYQALVQLGGYFVHPLLLVLLLTAVPLMLAGRMHGLPLAPIGVAAFGAPVMWLIGQASLYRDWPRRFAYFPLLLLVGTGIAFSTALAVWRALAGRPGAFRRTPKYPLDAGRNGWMTSGYTLPVEPSVWAELALCLYATVAVVLAATRVPALVPFMMLYALGFGFVGGMGLLQAGRVRHARRRMRVSRAWARVDAPRL